METGNLNIKTTTGGNIGAPLSGVRIEVFNANGRSVWSGTTDESGNADGIVLSAPNRELSQTQSSALPFGLYTIRAKKSGYADSTVENVRIFSGETAIQDIAMLTSGETKGKENDVRLPVLEVCCDENKPTENPLKADPRVLENVVIPSYIIVHDGAATNSSAANYRVLFTEYIKNVASNEIYSTWKPAALCANIRAIISFTLNRIYTEWYPSKGYNFTITSDTNTDHKYIPGATIYKTINDMVDELFNQYIVKGNVPQPYLAQYRSDTTTPGIMSQWGSQELAIRGYTCDQILKYYYGDDITIKTAPVVDSLPSSYPGVAMRKGDCSGEILHMQRMLNVIRTNYPAIPKIPTLNGYFDDATEQAVKAFQKAFGLTQDGVVGKSTWWKISLAYTAVAGLQRNTPESVLAASKERVRVTPTPQAYSRPTLKFGSTGAYVTEVQEILRKLGYYIGEVDGKFGSQTERAVKSFQYAFGLTADGIVGPKTWTYLLESVEEPAPCTGDEPTPSPEPTPDCTPYTVKAGDTLWKLAERYGTTVAAIKAASGITSDNLQIGQQLCIPSGGGTGCTPYTVKAGDTLWALANRYGTTVNAIKAASGITSDRLQIGQQLCIPN